MVEPCMRRLHPIQGFYLEILSMRHPSVRDINWCIPPQLRYACVHAALVILGCNLMDLAQAFSYV